MVERGLSPRRRSGRIPFAVSPLGRNRARQFEPGRHERDLAWECTGYAQYASKSEARHGRRLPQQSPNERRRPLPIAWSWIEREREGFSIYP